MSAISDKKEELDRLTCGFIVPIYSETAENGGQRNLLTTEDFDRVVAGFACSECLAKFVMYLATCPVCGHVRNSQMDMESHAPQLWVDHLRDVEAIEKGEKRAPIVVPVGIEQALREAREDPDVEQIRL